MDAGVKERWVAALRSGKYDQSTGALRNEDGYCCLGVLCDLHDKEWTASNWSKKKVLEHDGSAEWHYGNANVVLPKFVMDWADVECNPHADGQSLAQMNDTGKSFAHIADIIETYL